MRRPLPKRLGKWTAIPLAVREAAHRKNCGVCGDAYGRLKAVVDPRFSFLDVRENLDHLIPRRWLEERDINPHQQANLLSVCGSCHGQKKGLEDKLFNSDVVGWLMGLRQIGYPVDRILNFAIGAGLEEFRKFLPDQRFVRSL